MAEPPAETRSETTAAPPDETPEPAYGYTYGQPSGNRVVQGTGRLPESEPVDVRLSGVPVWVAGVPLGGDTAWVVVLEDGRIEAFRLSGSEATTEPIAPDRLSPGQPPLLRASDGSLELVTSENPRASELSHHAPAPGGMGTVGFEIDGGLFAEFGDGPLFLENPGVTALPDARIVVDAGADLGAGSGEMALLSGPTEAYEHDVLGDGVEATALTLLEPGDRGLSAVRNVPPASGGVFEAVAPLWFDVPDAPGVEGDLLAVTESVDGLGGRVSVYSPDGSLAAAGPFIGEPQRWRHVLAAGPFGPDGETEVVAVRTPHLAAEVEFYRPDFDAGTLEISAAVPGYTSHRINSRNLDTARAGDLDGDGRWELLVPNQDYTELGAVRRTETGAEVAWTLPVGGTVVTNLASATDPGGRAAVAAGRSDGVLRIWR